MAVYKIVALLELDHQVNDRTATPEPNSETLNKKILQLTHQLRQLEEFKAGVDAHAEDLDHQIDAEKEKNKDLTARLTEATRSLSEKTRALDAAQSALQNAPAAPAPTPKKSVPDSASLEQIERLSAEVERLQHDLAQGTALLSELMSDKEALQTQHQLEIQQLVLEKQHLMVQVEQTRRQNILPPLKKSAKLRESRTQQTSL